MASVLPASIVKQYHMIPPNVLLVYLLKQYKTHLAPCPRNKEPPMPSRTAFILRLVRAIAAADLARDEPARVTFVFALREMGIRPAWIERVTGEHVARLQRQAVRLVARIGEAA
jgi:hypothetical protein